MKQYGAATFAVWLVAGLLLAVSAATAQSTRVWYKETKVVEVDGEQHVKWSKIGTSDHASPYLQRHLLQDQVGRLLVLRASTDLEMETAVLTYEILTSGEMLTIQQLGTELVFQFGDDSLVIPGSEYEPTAEDFHAGHKNQARAIIANASQEFQDALRDLAHVGCLESPDLYPRAFLYAQLLYDNLYCLKEPSIAPEKKEGNRDTSFDPYAKPPTPFEVQFGSAYYE